MKYLFNILSMIIADWPLPWFSFLTDYPKVNLNCLNFLFGFQINIQITPANFVSRIALLCVRYHKKIWKISLQLQFFWSYTVSKPFVQISKYIHCTSRKDRDHRKKNSLEDSKFNYTALRSLELPIIPLCCPPWTDSKKFKET